MAKISVVIPVYGVEKYIERCARSLFEQTLDDIEYLFIDDCTPDKSIDILVKVLADYPNRKSQVSIHRMQENSGQAKVREYGMKLASGDYIIHCDTDDWLEKDMYLQLYNCAISTHSDIVFCDYFLEYDSGCSVYFHRNIPFSNKIQLIELMLSGFYNANALWGALVNRNLLRGLLYPTGNQGEDSVIMMQLIYNSSKMMYLKVPLYHYYINSSSITRSTDFDKVKNRVYDGISNVAVLSDFLKRVDLLDRFSEQFVSYKYNIRLFLWNYMANKCCREMWNKVFPEINSKIIFNKFIPFRLKLYQLIYLFGMSRYFSH